MLLADLTVGDVNYTLLSKADRGAIARTVQRLRELFEKEFTLQATGTFGLHADHRASDRRRALRSLADPKAAIQPWAEPRDALKLTRSQELQRDELAGAIAYLHREGLDGGTAVSRLISEAAFTAINRVLAVRVAEANGMLPQAITRGRTSSGYRDVVHDLFPLLAQVEDEGLWMYIQICGDELAGTTPLLFNRCLPTDAFVPGRTCVDNAIAIVNDPDVAQAWSAPEALGWAYQFFNKKDERERMRRESNAPRDSRELAIRNQFVTPRYIVDWLVQNTLGRRLRQAGYNLRLPLLVGEVGSGSPLELDEVRVLDPAVGSGHFLVGCYDLLEQAWASRSVSAAEAAPHILQCLHGIDVDLRASQVAQVVLVLRARQATLNGKLKPPVIATARPLPSAPEIRQDVFGQLPPNTRELARKLADGLDDEMKDAASLGSLLRVESRLDTAVREALHTGKVDERGITVHRLERDLLDAFEEIASRTDASPADRLFAGDARDAVQFIRLCKKQYDVVLMNPPFGDPVNGTNGYLKSAYGSSAVDLYTAFVTRGLERLNEHGYLGAITSRTGFFLTSLESWRSRHVLPRILALIDLGVGVMHDAMVETAAYVLTARPHHGQAEFHRCLDYLDKSSAVYEGAHETFFCRPEDFVHIPGSPAAYWLSADQLDILTTHPSIEGPNGSVRVGLQTSNDFRFVRLWWEVPTGKIGRMMRWVPFAKGGNYSPYYANLNLVVDWEHNGRGIREGARSRGESESRIIRSESHYFRPGLTWSRRSQKGFSVRPIPAGAIFGEKGPMIFVASDSAEDLDRLMAYLNSSLAAALLEAMVAFGSYEVGAIQRLPFIDPGYEARDLARELTAIRMAAAERLETDHLFVSPWAGRSKQGEKTRKLSHRIDETVSHVVGEKTVARPLSAMYPMRWFETDYEVPGASTPSQELSYLLGAVFGRWDIRIAAGILEPPPMPGPYDPLPPVSRGTLVGKDGLPAYQPPPDYPLNIPHDRLLHDESGHPNDVVAAIEAAIAFLETVPTSPSLVVRREISDLRRHIRSRFFAEHVKVYSASRRYAPIYWYLAVPSREWGLWLYAPALSRELLFAIARAAHDKLRRLQDQVRQLQSGRFSTADRTTLERVDQVERLAGEVERFAQQAEEVAQSGWRPDLNDGLALCAAPLALLFAGEAWRKRVAQYGKDLEDGRYPWATVQRQFFGSGP